jgi:predicted NBD/HSP70 family sugar kinase
MRIGIDLGGTKIEAIALDDKGEELTRVRVATPKDDYRAILGALIELVAEVEKQTGEEGVGGHRHAGDGLAGHGAREERQHGGAHRPPAG